MGSEFNQLQLKRLKKLGIDKTDPKALSEEEINKFVRLNIDPSTITVNRVIDIYDRLLRGITIGEGEEEKKIYQRSTRFDSTSSSELMVKKNYFFIF